MPAYGMDSSSFMPMPSDEITGRPLDTGKSILHPQFQEDAKGIAHPKFQPEVENFSFA
ncbi:hypothetical protein PMIT1320_01633 [Prochlorococcus marinus str. MIT 1320]|nr:hypothetical protein PMIT1320_01633 [Prochlorococcus marinus str. MIT 1320]